MLRKDQFWDQSPGAALDVIIRLCKASELTLPVEYLAFLAFSNGGEGPIPMQPYNLCLDTAETVTINLNESWFADIFPGFILIGCDGGGEFIAFDARNKEPWPIVALDMTNTNITESRILIADDFRSLIPFIGTEAENA